MIAISNSAIECAILKISFPFSIIALVNLLKISTSIFIDSSSEVKIFVSKSFSSIVVNLDVCAVVCL